MTHIRSKIALGLTALVVLAGAAAASRQDQNQSHFPPDRLLEIQEMMSAD